jgi:malonyl CoA-acyl carrier protein transacylase/NAD(P)-dependent dehydrogenase (short-subunit alcohol dehydrogenase family)
VGLIEAHGTGTVVGDQTEAQALARVMREAGAEPQSCALGSIKSMIGHTKCAAGIAGLIKATLALHHRILPPTLVDRPNPKGGFEQGPLYLNTEPRPWVHGAAHPRHAGVSAFGFGGTNFHAVLAEYEGDFLGTTEPPLVRWPAELIVLARPDRDGLTAAVEQLNRGLAGGGKPAPADLAAACWQASSLAAGHPALAVVATSLEDLRAKLQSARERLGTGVASWDDPRGVYFAERPGDSGAAVAYLFPGQGAQYPNMLAQVALAFPEVREVLDRAELALLGRLERPLGRFLYPGPAFGPERERELREALTRADVAQPAIGAVSLGMLRLLENLGVEPAFLAGHSYGEYVALCAAGAVDADDLLRLSHRRGAVLRAGTAAMPGGMVALDADVPAAEELLAGLEGATAANSNSPTQTVVSGSEEALRALLERCRSRGVRGQRLPVACAFHSPLVAAARGPLAQALAEYTFRPPRRTVYANATAAPYPAEPDAIARVLLDHLTSPVRFREQIEALYGAGARLFVEVGPQSVLTGLVGQTLRNRPHLAVAADVKGRPGLVQLLHLLGQLVTRGIPVWVGRLFRGRALRPVDLGNLAAETGAPRLSPTTWIVNSVRNRPLNAPEPLLLGQRPAAGRDPGRPAEPAAPPPAPAVPALAPLANGRSPVGAAHEPAADDAARVMLRLQDLMARFLETQQSLMTSYLQGAGSVPDLGETPRVPGQPAPRTEEPPTPIEEPKPAGGEAAAAVPGPARDRAWLTTRLQELVSGRTGYPKEMLGLDVNLEADLGIDSIKRVEILAELVGAVPGGAAGEAGQGLPKGMQMGKLTGINTLRGIIDYLDAALNGAPSVRNGAPTQGAISAGHSEESSEPVPLQRGLVSLVDCPLASSPASLLSGGAVLLTDDGRGVAREMASRLADLGRRTALLRSSQAPGGDEEGVFAADLTAPGQVGDLLERVRREVGAVTGFVHLLPLAEGGAWDDRARRDVKSLFLLAKALGEELRQAGALGHAFLLAATALGGGFGFGDMPLSTSFSPGQGGVLGFVKGLAEEWPVVLVRGVDLAAEGRRPDELAELLLGELCDRSGPVEVGYQGRRRVTWEMRAAPLPPVASEARPLLESGAAVLVTGGARGITAAAAHELAVRFKPTLLLVGRSPLPPEVEPADTADLTSPQALKAALIARQEREGQPAVPALIEAEYQRLLHDRESRGNLARLRETGAAVHYFSLDVRDVEAFGAVLDEVQQRFGALAGVIHGAGVIEDRLVRDKTPESFDRVFDTKVVGARVLAGRLRPEQLRFCVFFASIASRFGNKGQADYAAANEVLSKLALDLDRRWPARVVSIAWGPWSGIGMVADLEKHLVRRGLRMISPQEGREMLVAELLHGRKGESEVILGGGAEMLVGEAGPAAPPVLSPR